MFDAENLEDNLNLKGVSDEDTCNSSELTSLFAKQFELQAETTVSGNDDYILHMCGGMPFSSIIAVGLSNSSCVVYDVSTVTKVATASGHEKTLSGIRFSPKSYHLLYSCSLDGTVKLWDLRTDMKKCKTEFRDETSKTNVSKPLTTFDISPDDRFICAGSELVDGDAYLMFWDVRTSKLLGGYWESHTDVITQVLFHPSKKNIMATGSTDGLINIFNVGKNCEDDALECCLNTESSVAKISWFGGDGSLSCITHTEDLQLWKMDGAEPEIQFSREGVAKCLQRKSVGHCYLINFHEEKSSGQLILLAGSTYKSGECLRSLEVTSEHIKPMYQFVNNKQIVRTSWYFENDGRFITGGEAGRLSVWKPSKVENDCGKLPSTPKPSNMKMPSKFNHPKKFSKPYTLQSN